MMNKIDIYKLKDYFDFDEILQKAEESINTSTVHITDVTAPNSPGGVHDYYSNGDYWWPNPETPDGLPYIRRDGETNPDNFAAHRLILRKMRTHVANLAAAYVTTRNETYAQKAVLFLKEFFLDESTRMNPHLLYAQAIPGVCSGRGIGIIDTLHLIDVPMAILALQSSSYLSKDIMQGLEQWFSDYLHWMSTHENGIEEMNEENNHSICWFVQAAAFAQFTGNRLILEHCKKAFTEKILPNQMNLNGSFPKELARTKPYGYSMFVLDNMVTLCHILSTMEDNLWTYQLPDGRGIQKGLDFFFPYIAEKESWPFPQDVEHFESWPVSMSFLLFSGLAYENEDYLTFWGKLDKDPKDSEVRRNMAIRQPLLWLKNSTYTRVE